MIKNKEINTAKIRETTGAQVVSPQQTEGNIVNQDVVSGENIANKVNINNNEQQNINSQPPVNKNFNFGGAVSYMVDYVGDIKKEFTNIDFAQVLVITPFNAIIFVERGREQELLGISKTVQAVEIPNTYILTEISPIETSNIVKFNQGELIDLRGTGVIAGIIDTGIDYLNNEFKTEDGKTRITRIWDQTISTGRKPLDIGYGSEYTSEDINRAIEAQARGEDPYTIVPSKDIVGHGTARAGIIGARGYGEVRGAAPDCEFIAVKLRPADVIQAEALGVVTEENLYQSTDIAAAIYYLTEMQRILVKPMAILIPLGSNLGGHDGSSALERIVDIFALTRGLSFITGTGNQGRSETHTSGVLQNTGDKVTIELNIDQQQRVSRMEIWCNYPDKMSVGFVSPTGEIIRKLPVKIQGQQDIKLLYEGTIVRVSYFYPENITGDELILIIFENLVGGIWKIELYGDYIVNGRYDAWINSRPVSKPETRFLAPDNNITLTIPSTSRAIVTTAYYNQTSDILGEQSGVGFTRDNRIKPELTAGGVNVLTTAPGGGTTTVTGSSVAASVVTGAIILLLQWGIVNGNDPKLYGEKLKAYLIRGTQKRPGDVYPNPEWGYGILDLEGVFQAIRGMEKVSSFVSGREEALNRELKNLELNIPKEVYYRLLI